MFQFRTLIHQCTTRFLVKLYLQKMSKSGVISQKFGQPRKNNDGPKTDKSICSLYIQLIKKGFITNMFIYVYADLY